ncbi:response regulator transcription factor [Chitinophaga silvisoli]|uniref:DNA-binding response regulator n=1 Tax=Chitinophaga silvisoli TaxID=2291814 RepID=A0A3E1P3X4_9BACT|nr:response regulator transcription factor [Chitinophaga silvisoli]RFM34896.1 DNA-binding response regulator [Chitinophaga silvisoli]
MKLLLIEDEPAVVSFIHRYLTEAGYDVTVAMDGPTGLQMAMEHSFQLIILDVMLPGMSGIAVCKELRSQQNKTPILMLTALGSTENVVSGLDSGADDYLIKPFKQAELLARIRSLLRRQPDNNSNNTVTAPPAVNLLKLADLELNTDTKSASRSGESITLTATEYRLLEYFLRNPRRVLSRMEILENVWGIDFNMNTKVVDVYVNYLRKKVNRKDLPALIQTVVGMGYMLKEEA